MSPKQALYLDPVGVLFPPRLSVLTPAGDLADDPDLNNWPGQLRDLLTAPPGLVIVLPASWRPVLPLIGDGLGRIDACAEARADRAAEILADVQQRQPRRWLAVDAGPDVARESKVHFLHFAPVPPGDKYPSPRAMRRILGFLRAHEPDVVTICDRLDAPQRSDKQRKSLAQHILDIPPGDPLPDRHEDDEQHQATLRGMADVRAGRTVSDDLI